MISNRRRREIHALGLDRVVPLAERDGGPGWMCTAITTDSVQCSPLAGRVYIRV